MVFAKRILERGKAFGSSAHDPFGIPGDMFSSEPLSCHAHTCTHARASLAPDCSAPRNRPRRRCALIGIDHEDSRLRRQSRFIVEQMAARHADADQCRWSKLIAVMASLENHDVYQISPTLIHIDDLQPKMAAAGGTSDGPPKPPKPHRDVVAIDAQASRVSDLGYPWLMKMWGLGLRHKNVHVRRLFLQSFLARDWHGAAALVLKYEFETAPMVQGAKFPEIISVLAAVFDDPDIHRQPMAIKSRVKRSIHVEGLASFFSCLLRQASRDALLPGALSRLIRRMKFHKAGLLAREAWIAAIDHATLGCVSCEEGLLCHTGSMEENWRTILESMRDCVVVIRKQSETEQRVLYGSLVQIAARILCAGRTFIIDGQAYDGKPLSFLACALTEFLGILSDCPVSFLRRDLQSPLHSLMERVRAEVLSSTGTIDDVEQEFSTLMRQFIIDGFGIGGRRDRDSAQTAKRRFVSWFSEAKRFTGLLYIVSSNDSGFEINRILAGVHDFLASGLDDDGMLEEQRGRALLLLNFILDLQQDISADDGDGSGLRSWIQGVFVSCNDAIARRLNLVLSSAKELTVAEETSTEALALLTMVNSFAACISATPDASKITSMMWSVLPRLLESANMEKGLVYDYRELCGVRCLSLALSAVDRSKLDGGPPEESQMELLAAIGGFAQCRLSGAVRKLRGLPLESMRGSTKGKKRSVDGTAKDREAVAQIMVPCLQTLDHASRVRGGAGADPDLVPLLHRHLSLYGGSEGPFFRVGFEEMKAIAAAMHALHVELHDVYGDAAAQTRASALETQLQPRIEMEPGTSPLAALAFSINRQCIGALMACSGGNPRCVADAIDSFVGAVLPPSVFCGSEDADALHTAGGPISSVLRWALSIENSLTSTDSTCQFSGSSSLMRALLQRLCAGLLEHPTAAIASHYVDIFVAMTISPFPVPVGCIHGEGMTMADDDASHGMDPSFVDGFDNSDAYVRVMLASFLHELSGKVSDEICGKNVRRAGSELFHALLPVVCHATADGSGTAGGDPSRPADPLAAGSKKNNLIYPRLGAIHRRHLRALQIMTMATRFLDADDVARVECAIFNAIFVPHILNARAYIEKLFIAILAKASGDVQDRMIKRCLEAMDPGLGMFLSDKSNKYDGGDAEDKSATTPSAFQSRAQRNMGIASVIMIAGIFVRYIATDDANDMNIRDAVIRAVVCWTVTHNHQLRAISLIVLRCIFGEEAASADRPEDADTGDEERICPANEYLRSLLRFTEKNPHTVDVLVRVEAMVKDYEPARVTQLRNVFDCGGDSEQGEYAGTASVTSEQIKCEAAPLSMLERIGVILLDGAQQMRAAMGHSRNSKEEYLKKLSMDASRTTVATGANVDFQRKIGPAILSDTFFNSEGQFVHADAKDLGASDSKGSERAGSSSLIVVASLLDKPANLGGLSRTCEVFGATKLILPSLSLMRSDEFKGVAASSDRHLDIDEVAPAHLLAFLQRMRAEGFSLIGLEQTMESRSLLDFQFPKRTCLILGHGT